MNLNFRIIFNISSKFQDFILFVMYVCRPMYVFFISQPQQHKSKNKNTIKAEKKEAVKNDIRCRTCKQYIVEI